MALSGLRRELYDVVFLCMGYAVNIVCHEMQAD